MIFKKMIIAQIFVFLMCLFSQAQDIDAYFVSGISNRAENKSKEYVTPGDRAYIIGNQDGSFPDMGGHVKGEMGGLWVHPIKMMDGFWLNISDNRSGESIWVTNAEKFINYPFGNKLVYPEPLNKMEITRFQFCPDGQAGIVIEYTLKNLSDGAKDLTLEFAVKTDISPVWFSKEIGIEDSEDIAEWNASQDAFTAKDDQHPWHIMWGSSQKAIFHSISNEIKLPENTKGKGVKASSSYNVKLPSKKSASIVFVVTGSNHNPQEAASVYESLQRNYTTLLKQKKEHYRTILQQTKITIPDKSLQQVFDWVKINTAWLVRTVPEIGTGLTAGYMEYPWWFGCDNTYSLQAVLATGNMELAKQTLRLLYTKSKETNGNGRIVHEISTNGGISNKGNTQETAHFL
jgi:hypothetical protein